MSRAFVDAGHVGCCLGRLTLLWKFSLSALGKVNWLGQMGARLVSCQAMARLDISSTAGGYCGLPISSSHIGVALACEMHQPVKHSALEWKQPVTYIFCWQSFSDKSLFMKIPAANLSGASPGKSWSSRNTQYKAACMRRDRQN